MNSIWAKAALCLFLVPSTLWAALAVDRDNEIVRDPRVQAELEVFVVDEEELELRLEDLTDDEIFGEDGLLSYLREYSALASRRGGGGGRVRALSRSCAAPRSGGASWYGPGFHGRRTANGERFNTNSLTAAHKTLKFGSVVKVTYRGRSVNVRINDAGPYAGGRVIDLSKAAASKIGLLGAGHGQVRLSLVRCR